MDKYQLAQFIHYSCVLVIAVLAVAILCSRYSLRTSWTAVGFATLILVIDIVAVVFASLTN